MCILVLFAVSITRYGEPIQTSSSARRKRFACVSTDLEYIVPASAHANAATAVHTGVV